MGDSSSFSSLFALVDSHLSKSNLNQDCCPSTSGLGSIRLPPFNINRGSSDTRLPSSSLRFPIPSTSTSEHPINDGLSKQLGNMFYTDKPAPEVQPSVNGNVPMRDCPINDVLAMQLSNMFKARQAREEEEKRKLAQQKEEEELRASCMIDLMPAIRYPGQIEQAAMRSAGSSTESLALPDTTEDMDKPEEAIDLAIPGPSRPVSPLKPISEDMRYVLKHKMGKCSNFGKVICARYRPVAAPYLKVHIPHHIPVFDFSTPSPDDIAKERRKRVTYYNNTLSPFE